MSRHFGHYVIHCEVGRGGTATVFAGTDLESGRRVAIKKLHEFLATDPRFASMLAEEARLGARIESRHAVPIRDLVASDGNIFAVMEYIHGESLAGVLKTSSSGLPLPICTAIVSDALAGLQAAHQARGPSGEHLGLVHRDVAPDNILIGTDGLARLTDFGIAKALGRGQVTATGVVKGKLRYMAPEQAGGETSLRSDVFAMGVVLWECLTGRHLFDAEHESTVLSQLISQNIVAPSTIRSGLSTELDAVVMRALARAPDARFGSAGEMREALMATGVPASHTAVAAYLNGACGPRLEERALQLAAHEADACLAPAAPGVEAPAPPPSSQTTPVTGTLVMLSAVPPQAKRSRTMLTAAAVAAAAALVLWLLQPGARADAAATAAEAPATAEPVPTPVAASSSSGAEGAEAPLAPLATSAGRKAPRTGVVRARPTEPARQVAGCNPPYTVDSTGVRVYRLECFE